VVAGGRIRGVVGRRLLVAVLSVAAGGLSEVAVGGTLLVVVGGGLWVEEEGEDNYWGETRAK